MTAVNEATGNMFFSVTDERGSYRIQVRVGRYRMTMELPGFATTIKAFEALVGQSLDHDQSLQERGGRIEMESRAVRGEIRQAT